jgi:hypothetical protein
MRRLPYAASVLDQEHLWRLVPDAEALCDGVRQFAILNDENHATEQIVKSFHKICELFVGLRTDRTLRAMLENENRIGFRPLHESFEILILS